MILPKLKILNKTLFLNKKNKINNKIQKKLFLAIYKEIIILKKKNNKNLSTYKIMKNKKVIQKKAKKKMMLVLIKKIQNLI